MRSGSINFMVKNKNIKNLSNYKINWKCKKAWSWVIRCFYKIKIKIKIKVKHNQLKKAK